jgi:phenylacetate-CoA ligase
MDLYADLVQRALYPLWEGTIRGRPTLALLHHLEQTERRSLDELEALQLGALRRLLRHSYDHVPFYRARLDAAAVKPEDVRTLSDLRRLPILDRIAVRSAGAARASIAPPLPTIHKATSGSSGEPLAIAYDRGSENWRQATKLRGYGWAGYRVGVRTVHYWGSAPLPAGLPRLKILADRRLRRERWLDCNARSDEALAAVASELEREPPHVVIGFAQAVADLARFANARGARRWPEVNVICAAERLFPSDREEIVKAFGPHVFETYGSREVMLIAAECEAHDGLHVSMENLVVELVVREGGRERPAEEGETGEVVITDLHNYGMPFLRYAAGDLAVSRGRGPCACGRNLVRIGPVEGRVSETLLDADGARISGLLFAVAFTTHGQALRGTQVIQHRDRSVTVRVECDVLDAETEASLRAYIEPYLRGLPLRFERVDTLALDPSGKRRRVIVER